MNRPLRAFAPLSETPTIPPISQPSFAGSASPEDHPGMLIASSPLWQNLLLEDPWPLALTFAVVAGVLVFLGIQRADKRLLRLAGIAAVLAAGVFILAGTVTTTRETILAATEKLVGHTAPLDVPAFRAMVDPQVIVTVESARGAQSLAGDAVFSRLESTVKSTAIEKQTTLAIDAELRGKDHAVSSFDVRTDVRGGPRFITRWVLTWRRQADGDWRVTEVRWLNPEHMLGVKPDINLLR